MLYALQDFQAREGSSDVVSGKLRVFNLDSLLDLVDTMSFVTP